MSTSRKLYGQLSGMVEPVFGVLGAVAVSAAQPVLPYALAFAAGAMIYVVADDIIPEANASGNGKLATWGCIIGFVVMMCLDVGLGQARIVRRSEGSPKTKECWRVAARACLGCHKGGFIGRAQLRTHKNSGVWAPHGVNARQAPRALY
ncbi:unnamed protein product, partial [Iphiclides podalirius]